MTVRWDLEKKNLEQDIILYAAPKVTQQNASNQGLTSAASFANMCLMSGTHNTAQMFGGMYGLLCIIAGPKKVKFIESELRQGEFVFSNFRLVAKEVNDITDIYFGSNNSSLKYKPSSLDVSKGYKGWVENPERIFNNLHNRRALVQLGIILCTLGKDVYVEWHYIRLIDRWLYAFRNCFNMEVAILVESLPSQNALANLYSFFVTHLYFRSKIFTFILKYSKSREHLFGKLCGMVSHLLKFSEMEHVCLITEYFAPAFCKENFQNLFVNFKETIAIFLDNFIDMKREIPDFSRNYKYAMLLYPGSTDHLIREPKFLILTFLAMKFADNPHNFDFMFNKKFLKKAEAHKRLSDEERIQFLTEVLKYYTNISRLYEGIDLDWKRYREDFMYSEAEKNSLCEFIQEWLQNFGTKVTDKKKKLF